MPNGNLGNNQHQYPFFAGIYYGALWRIPNLIVGAFRTAGNLGLQGPDVQQQIQNHNWFTCRAMEYGYRYALGAPVDMDTINRVWQALPAHVQEAPVNWAQQQIGQAIGGAIPNYFIAQGLMKYLPKKVVTPAMIIISCQGMLGFLWRDAWGDGPPPPPPPAGGGADAPLLI